MTQLEPADMTREVFYQKIRALAEAAIPLGIHMDVFMTALYKDGSTGTDYDGNHKSPEVWASVIQGIERLIEGEYPQDQAHPDQPKPAGPN